MTIYVAVPTFESIYPDTYKSIYEMDKNGHDVIFDFVRGYDVATARNRIAQNAIDQGADYALMVDNDVVVPENILTLLLYGGKDVCLGYYAHRGTNNRYNGRTCVCKLKDDHGNSYYNYPGESEYTAEELKRLQHPGRQKYKSTAAAWGAP